MPSSPPDRRYRLLWIGDRSGEGDSLSKGIEPAFDIRYASEFQAIRHEPVPPHEIHRRSVHAGFEPDVLYFWNPSIMNDYTGWEIPCGPSIAHHVDSHFSFPWQSHLTPLFDTNFLEVQSAARYFWRNGQDSLPWCPPCFHGTADDVRRHPPYLEREWDVSFVGSMNSDVMPHRVNFFRRLAERLRGRYRIFFGKTPDPVGAIYARSKIVINYTTRPAWAFIPDPMALQPHAAGLNGRTFDAMGHGAMLLADMPSPDLAALFREGEHFSGYRVNDVEDATNKIEYYLTHEDNRLAVALAGWQEIQEHHTYPARGRHLASLITTAIEGKRDPSVGLAERKFLLGRSLLRMALQTPDPNIPELRRNHLSKLKQARLLLEKPNSRSNEALRRSLVPLFDTIEGRPDRAIAQWFHYWESDRCPMAALLLEIALRWMGDDGTADRVAGWRTQSQDAQAALPPWDLLDLSDMLFIIQKFPKELLPGSPLSSLLPTVAPPASTLPLGTA